MPNLVHFEIAADHLDRAVKFYSKVFDWKIRKLDDDDEYFLIDDDDDSGLTGGLMQRVYPSDSTINTFDVGSINTFARKITEAGGKVLAPKIALPKLGYVLYCQDTEGNTFCIMEYDEAAR